MHKRNLTAALLALTLTASLCGCGDPYAKVLLKDNSEIVTVAPVQETSAAQTETTIKAVTSANDTAAENTNHSAAEPGTDEALAEAKRVLMSVMQAGIEKDAERYADNYCVELLYYMKNGELGDRDKYIEMIKPSIVKDNFPADMQVTEEWFDSIEYCPEKVDEYNDTFRKMDERNDGKYAFSNIFHVDGVYIWRVQNQAAAEAGGHAGSGLQIGLGTGESLFGMDMAVIRINGQWKVDISLPMIQTLLEIQQ